MKYKKAVAEQIKRYDIFDLSGSSFLCCFWIRLPH